MCVCVWGGRRGWSWGEGNWSIWLGHLCLLVGAYGRQAPPLPQRLGDWGSVFLMIHFKGLTLRSLGKTFLNCKTGKLLNEDLYLKETDK